MNPWGLDPEQKTEAPGKLCQAIADVLSSEGLQKYASIFEEEEIDLEAFLMLNDGDLRNMAIPTVPPPPPMLLVQSIPLRFFLFVCINTHACC